MTVKHAKKAVKKMGYHMRSGMRLRGSGNRGGVGRSGSGKRGRQKKTRYITEPRPKGFNTIYIKKKTINVGILNEQIPLLLSKGLVVKDKESFIVDASKLNIDKILGKGRVDKKLVITAKYFSPKAIDKIKKAGGDAVIPEK